jgi:uncharacterized repeat protein (TIGR03803 family)
MKTMKTMTTNRNTMLAVLCALLLGAANAPAQFNLLHSFAGGASDGSSPWYGAPTVSGSTLYGMTRNGGGGNFGTVFKMNTDGTGFTLLHSFTDGVSDGGVPNGSLTLSGSTLYGMTRFGGASDLGTAFKMNTDGTGFALLHSFDGGANDGQLPRGDLTLSGSTLYGMTEAGGSSGGGTAFKVNTDGTGFALLHTFTGSGGDGKYPNGSLTLDGSTLYGMTDGGGVTNFGTAFQMNTDGTGFTLLHSFTGGGSDGSFPKGSLTLSGSTLYGMTPQGGGSGRGTVFSIGVVPEPSSMGLVLLGLGLIGWRRLRLRRES